MERDRKLRFFALCSLWLCLLHASEIIRMVSLLSCASSCLASLRCGWVVHDEVSNQCHKRESLECDLVVRNSSAVYRRLLSGESPDRSNQRHSTFKLLGPKHMTCSFTMKSCDIPEPIPNATVEHDALIPGSRARYTCQNGFSFCGPNMKEVICLLNGSWIVLDNVCSQVNFTKDFHSAKHFPCPVSDGSSIVINGVLNDNAVYFQIYLMTEINTFSVKVIFPYNSEVPHVVLSKRHSDNTWTEKKNATTCPFSRSKKFDLVIAVKEEAYVLSEDGKTFVVYKHRSPEEILKAISVSGDVKLSYVLIVY